MTSPSGESDKGKGAKLASGYVELGVKYDQGHQQVVDGIQKIEDQGKISGDAAGKSITDALTQAGTNAPQGFRGGFASGMQSVMDDVGPQAADTLRGHLATGIIAGLSSDSGFRAGFADSLRTTMEQSGSDSGHQWRTNFEQGILDGVETGGKSIFAGLFAGLGEGLEENRSRISEYKDQLKETGENLNVLGIEGGEAAEKLGGIGEALFAIVSDPVVLATASVAALAASAYEVTEKLYELGEQWEDTFHSIQTQTGATGEEMEGLEDNVKTVAQNVGVSVDKIGQDVGSAFQLFGDRGDDVNKVSQQLAEAQARFGDFDLRSVGRDFRAFDVQGADNQINSLNAIAAANQKTGITFDELASSTANLAPVAKQFNLNFEETTGLMTSFEKAGIDPAKVFISLTTAQRELSKSLGTDDPQSLRNGLIATLDAAKQLADQGDRAGAVGKLSEVFGKQTTRGGPDTILQALQSGMDPEKLAASLGNYQNLVDKNYQATKTWHDEWQQMKNDLSVALEPTGAGVLEAVGNGMKGLGDYVIAHKDAIIQGVKDVATGFSYLAQGAGDAVAGVMQIFGDLEAGVGRVVEGIGIFVRQIGSDWKALPSWLGGGDDGWGADVAKFGDDMVGVQQTMQSQSDTITQMGRNLHDATNNAADDFRDGINKPADDAKGKVEGLNTELDKVGDHKASPQIDTTSIDNAGVKLKSFMDQYKELLANPNAVAPGVSPPPGVGQTPPTIGSLLLPAGHEAGGTIHGMARNRDSVPIIAKVGEHMWTDDEVAAVGGQAKMYRMRSLAKRGLLKGFDQGGPVDPLQWIHDNLGGRGAAFTPGIQIDTSNASSSVGTTANLRKFMFGMGSGKVWERMQNDYNDYMGWLEDAGTMPEIRTVRDKQSAFEDGGAVGPDVAVADSLVGTPYSQGARNDCSGMVGRVVNGALGTGGGLPTTQNMGQWLAARGFVNGIGPAGTMSVSWYNHGSAPNDGHTAMTLSNGENAESGGSHGNFLVGPGAAGASSPEFDHHMYLPNLYGEGASTGVVSGATGSRGSAPSTEAIQSANSAVSGAQGAVTVAQQKLGEAQSAPLGKGKDAQAEHDRAVTSAQDALDKANRDLTTATDKRQNLLAGDTANGVVSAENAVADAKNRQADAQSRLDRLNATPGTKPSEITAAQNSLAQATDSVSRAQERLTKAKTDAAKGTDKTDKDSFDPAKEIGQVGSDFLKDNLPPGFSDPTSWPLVKTAAAALKWTSGLVGAKGDKQGAGLLGAGADLLGGDGGSAITDAIGAFSPDQPGDAPGNDALPAPGTGGSPFSSWLKNLPGLPDGDPANGGNNSGDTNVDLSHHVHGDIGSTEAAQKQQAATDARQARQARATIPRQIRPNGVG